jgi:hypothetical protein
VATSSSNRAWFVGGISPHSTEFPFIETWNGSKVAVTKTAKPKRGAVLTAVTAVSNSEAWAVGSTSTAVGTDTYILHFKDGGWKRVKSPSPSPIGSNFLYGVDALSAKNVWAVGYANDGSKQQTLTEHWNGHAWKVIASPDQGVFANHLDGVVVIGANDVWAVR